MEKQNVLAWRKGFEAVREVERAVIRSAPLDLKKSVRLGISLIEFCRRQSSWAYALQDPIRMREVEEVRSRWIRLKQASPK